MAKDSHGLQAAFLGPAPFKKPPPPRTLRQPSGKKPGGQKDHPGATLAPVVDPEHAVTMPLVGCFACGHSLSALPGEDLAGRRQVAALVVRREVTEYRAVRGLCACGQVDSNAWLAGVEGPVQYGPGVAALAGIALSSATLYSRGARGRGARERAGGGYG